MVENTCTISSKINTREKALQQYKTIPASQVGPSISTNKDHLLPNWPLLNLLDNWSLFRIPSLLKVHI